MATKQPFKIENRITRDQAAHLRRRMQAFRYRRPKIDKPANVLAAEKIVDAWGRKEGAAQEVYRKKIEAVISKIEETLLFKSPAEALKMIQDAELRFAAGLN